MSLPYNARPKSCVFFILHFSVFRIHLLPCPSPTNQLSLDPLQPAHRLHMPWDNSVNKNGIIYADHTTLDVRNMPLTS